MKNIDFVLYYEHWQRELYGLLLLKAELECRGYSVKIGEECINKENDLICSFYQPEVIVYPWIYSDIDVKRAMHFKRPVNKMVNLQCEQIYSPRSIENGFFVPKQNAKKAFHVCWGPKMRERFLQYGVEEKKLLKVGSINLDINQSEFSSVFRSRHEIAEEYGLDERKDWVIFFSNFKFPSMDKKKLEYYESVSKGVKELNELMCGAKEKTLQYIKTFLTKYDSIEMIYRPHPAEPLAGDLINLQKQLKNFHYIREDTIQQWIKVCDKFLTWNSTSVVDVYIANKSFGLLRPEEIPSYYDAEIFTGCQVINNYEAFQEFMLSNKKEQPIVKDEIIKHFYNVSQPEKAYQKLADQLINIYNKEAQTLNKHFMPPPSVSRKMKLYFNLLRLSEWINLDFMDRVFQRWNVLRIKEYRSAKIREKDIYKKIKNIIRKRRKENV